jgi:DNA-binding beta-propeller fold protein YncE
MTKIRLRPGREAGGLMRRTIAALALLAVAALGITGCSGTPQPARATAPIPAPAPRQTVLPFTGLENPHDLAVDTAGNVYVTDLRHTKDQAGHPSVNRRVIKLPAGSNTQTVLPQFADAGVASDAAGAVWVVDAGHEQLVKLAAGSDAQTVLPLPDLGLRSELLAVDAAGSAYGADGGGVYPDGGCCRPVHVVKAEAGSHTPTVLPFTHILGVGGMAVDSAGNVYAGDFRQVLKLAAGTNTETVLPFDLGSVGGMAVDSAGSLYVVDAERKQVLKMAAGADKPIVLPFSGLNHPVTVAVDAAGSVYVADIGNHNVVKLNPGDQK